MSVQFVPQLFNFDKKMITFEVYLSKYDRNREI